jgi:hypothetical protein
LYDEVNTAFGTAFFFCVTTTTSALQPRASFSHDQSVCSPPGRWLGDPRQIANEDGYGLDWALRFREKLFLLFRPSDSIDSESVRRGVHEGYGFLSPLESAKLRIATSCFIRISKRRIIPGVILTRGSL